VQSGNIALAADQVREMNEAFAEAGLELTAEAHFAHAALGAVTANLAAVREHGHAAIDLSHQAGDRYAEGWYNATLAMFVASHGDTESAVQLAEGARAVGVELGNPTLLGLSDVAMGYAFSTIDADAAIPHLEKGLAVLRAVGNETIRYTGERSLARLFAQRGEISRALDIYANVLEACRADGSAMQIKMTCESVAVDLATAGHHEDAATILGALGGQHTVPSPFVNRRAATDALQHTMGSRFHECVERGLAFNPDELVAFARDAIARATVGSAD
jgi:hypothetical protein